MKRGSLFRSALLLRSGNGNGPTIGGAEDSARGDEACERVAEALVADAEFGTELGAAERTTGAHQEIEDTAIDVVGRIGIGGCSGEYDGEMGVDILTRDEVEAQWIGSRGSAVLDGEQQAILLSSDVEIAISPCVEITAAAERQASLGAGTAIFAGMVYDKDGDVVLALERAEVAEQGGDFAGIVFIDPVKTNKGVEHEQAWPELADGGA